jgi:hypothetical protein
MAGRVARRAANAPPQAGTTSLQLRLGLVAAAAAGTRAVARKGFNS